MENQPQCQFIYHYCGESFILLWPVSIPILTKWRTILFVYSFLGSSKLANWKSSNRWITSWEITSKHVFYKGHQSDVVGLSAFHFHVGKTGLCERLMVWKCAEIQFFWKSCFYIDGYFFLLITSQKISFNNLITRSLIFFILQGKTGFPWIDAMMRQMLLEGWIPHLARQAVGCFLTRGALWICWEEGFKVCVNENYTVDSNNELL